MSIPGHKYICNVAKVKELAVENQEKDQSLYEPVSRLDCFQLD